MNKASQEVLKFAERPRMSTHADSATGAASAFKSETRTIRHRQPQKSQSYRRSGASRGPRSGYSRCLIGGRTITSVVKKARNIWKGVPKAAGYAALKVCLSVYHRLETESMAAIHRDAILHIDGETPTRALSVASQHVKFKEMSSSVDLGVPQH